MTFGFGAKKPRRPMVIAADDTSTHSAQRRPTRSYPTKTTKNHQNAADHDDDGPLKPIGVLGSAKDEEYRDRPASGHERAENQEKPKVLTVARSAAVVPRNADGPICLGDFGLEWSGHRRPLGIAP